MTEVEARRIAYNIEQEGFEYGLLEYQSYDYIQDPTFQRYLNAYRNARYQMASYLAQKGIPDCQGILEER